MRIPNVIAMLAAATALLCADTEWAFAAPEECGETGCALPGKLTGSRDTTVLRRYSPGLEVVQSDDMLPNKPNGPAALKGDASYAYPWGVDTDPSPVRQTNAWGLGSNGLNACFDMVRTDGAYYRVAGALSGAGTTAFDNLPSDPVAQGRSAAQNHVRGGAMVEFTEPVVFTVILGLVAIGIWRERRVLRRRHLTLRVLAPALPALGLLGGAVYMQTLYSGSSHVEVAALGRLLEPIALAVLLALTLVSWMRFERPARQKTVLAIGAHPDDIEFGCGATILRMRKEGAATYGLVLTSGERGHNHGNARRLRVDEAREAARVMALCDIEIHDFPDTALREYKSEIRSAIEAALTRWRPDVIFTHNGHDVHTDHHTTFEATREAARGAYTILCYENPNTPPGFHPEYFFDVGEHLDGKIAALACHRTQSGKPYTAGSIVRAMAGFRGTQARVPLAEGFEVMRVLEKARAQ